MIGYVISGIAVCISAIGLFLTAFKNRKEQSERDGRIMEKLDSMDKKLDGLESKVTAHSNILVEHTARLAVLEDRIKRN